MNEIIETVLILPGIIIGLSVHEFAHAYVALKCGDDTAYKMGRVSLNPLRHIDPFGLLFLIIAKFGWAKPVMFTRENLGNPRRDEILISLAGPLSNLVLAVGSALVLKMLLPLWNVESNALSYALFTAFLYLIIINIGLFVFNLLPIPPLDGSHVLAQTLKLGPKAEQIFYRFGTIGLLVLIVSDRYFENIDLLPTSYLINWILNFLAL
jgi:Zn-dependent protease